VNLLPSFTIKELHELLASSAREDAEVAARTLGKTAEQVTAAGEEASTEAAAAAVNPIEPSVQLVLERFFLRQWRGGLLWTRVNCDCLMAPCW
jgi:hypothetical protein